jgi:hypothetical protein
LVYRRVISRNGDSTKGSKMISTLFLTFTGNITGYALTYEDLDLISKHEPNKNNQSFAMWGPQWISRIAQPKWINMVYNIIE